MARELIPGGSEPETPSNTVSYFLREAVRRLWISKRTSFVAIAMIAMSLLILGSFLLVAENLGRAVAQWQGQSRVSIYLDAETTPEQITAIQAWLAAHPDLGRPRFVTKEEALARFKRDFTNLSDVVGQLDENPFPVSFECEVTPRVAQSQQFHREMQELRGVAGVDQVQFDWEWLDRLKRIVNLINAIGLVAGGILAVAAAFTIANVIRLTMLLYREEIEIMRLVGATERIIRGPFLIEGLLQGTIGGLLAVGLLFGGFELTRRALAPSSSLLWGFLFHGFLPWQKIVALVLGGTLAGWFGSWLSVRETSAERA
ncbi:MAG: putative Cell division protein FtsX [Acidobacteria bacterium]|nr:putative Cell division protein FtsX [Acidobacteriota bacterium]